MLSQNPTLCCKIQTAKIEDGLENERVTHYFTHSSVFFEVIKRKRNIIKLYLAECDLFEFGSSFICYMVSSFLFFYCYYYDYNASIQIKYGKLTITNTC